MGIHPIVASLRVNTAGLHCQGQKFTAGLGTHKCKKPFASPHGEFNVTLACVRHWLAAQMLGGINGLSGEQGPGRRLQKVAVV